MTARKEVAATLGSPRGHDEQATYVLVPSSPVSADSTTASTELGFDTPSSVNRTLGGEGCSPTIGPESPSTTTCAKWLEGHENIDGKVYTSPEVPALMKNPQKAEPFIFSVAGFPAKTSPSPANAEGSPETGPGCSLSSPESQTLFNPDGYSSRTYQGSSPRTAVGTSESCLERWPTSGTAWHGGFSTAVSSECRSDDAGCSSSEPSLSEILEPPQDVPARYLLSARAARGILRRAEKRGRSLPSHLSAALEAVARTTTTGKAAG